MSLKVRSLHYRYGSVTALADLSLELPQGQIWAVLGPSGSGKTTLLGLLAGLLAPTAGEIWGEGRLLSRPGWALPPERRRMSMVFQDFALWPHMTVAQTVAFPLTVAKVPESERRRRVEEVLRSVRLEAFAKRYPHELSGGQRQRVAIARALVGRPSLVLLDEPMSNLDARLRESMRLELAATLRQEGVSALYVTHDRIEALAIADKILLMDAGKKVQEGTPQDLYQRPQTRFAVDFMGAANLLAVKPDPDRRGVWTTGFGVRLHGTEEEPRQEEGQALWLLRPEQVALSAKAAVVPDGIVWAATVTDQVYLGAYWEVALRNPDGTQLRAHSQEGWSIGEEVTVAALPTAPWLIHEPMPGQETDQPKEASLQDPQGPGPTLLRRRIRRTVAPRAGASHRDQLARAPEDSDSTSA